MQNRNYGFRCKKFVFVLSKMLCVEHESGHVTACVKKHKGDGYGTKTDL